MTIKDIEIVENKDLPKFKRFKERFNVFIPNINLDTIPRRNGFIYLICGAAGSGKTNMMLNFFKSKKLYRGIFNNIYYIIPEVSFSSLQNNPLADANNIYHDLNIETLTEIYNDLLSKKQEYVSSLERKKDKKEKVFDDEDTEDEEEKEKELEYSVVVLDDMSDELKNNDIQKYLKKFLIKSRHLNVAFIILVQSYYLYPKQLRKMLMNISLFKPQNYAEFESFCDEILNLKKNDAMKLYDFCFGTPYNHLDVDVVLNKYFLNFNQLNLVK